MTRKKDPKKYQTIPCTECGAKCCRYVAIEIHTPKTKREYDDIRWYLLHENVHVYIDHSNAWHVEFRTRCRSLADDHRCIEYETRPQICRDYGWPIGSCEFFDSPYKQRFESLEAFETYLDKKKIDWRYRRRPKKKV
jgi:uncharacterized protein